MKITTKPVHLAIETNFVLGIAKGQDANAAEVLAIPAEQLPLILPAGCVMEAWVAFDKYQAELRQFSEGVKQQIQQTRRNQDSLRAVPLVDALEEVLELHSRHADQEAENFRVALKTVTDRAILVSSSEAVVESLSNEHIRAKRDNAIFAEILVYARQNPDIEVVLLTSNSSDFYAPAKANALRYFSKTSDFSGWFASR